MALFGSQRDASLMAKYAKEIYQSIVSLEVEIFKMSSDDSRTNLYGEGTLKVYYNPVRFFCLLRKDDKTALDNDLGIDYTKTIQFNFLRDDLVTAQFKLDVGDIIKFDEQYFEVDNIRDSQYWMGRNDETLLANSEGRISRHGYNISILAEAHLSKLTALQLVETYQGNIPRVTHIHNYL